MALRSGYFSSKNGDRKYSAQDHGELISTMVTDGVHPNYGKQLFPKESGIPNTIYIQTGRSWFDNTWMKNDTLYLLEMPEPDLLLARWDTVYQYVDKSESVRSAGIEVMQGVASASPVAPKPTDTDLRTHHIMCYVYRAPNNNTILNSNIQNRIATSDYPLMTGILETIVADDLLVQWQSEFVTWNDAKQAEFMDWFNDLKDLMTEDVALHLQNQITDNLNSITSNSTAIINVNSTLASVISNANNRGLGNTGAIKYLTTPGDISFLISSSAGNGLYLSSVLTNGPDNRFWYYHVIKYTETTGRVVAYGYNFDEMKIAHWYNATWSGWKDIPTLTWDGTTLSLWS